MQKEGDDIHGKNLKNWKAASALWTEDKTGFVSACSCSPGIWVTAAFTIPPYQSLPLVSASLAIVLELLLLHMNNFHPVPSMALGKNEEFSCICECEGAREANMVKLEKKKKSVLNNISQSYRTRWVRSIPPSLSLHDSIFHVLWFSEHIFFSHCNFGIRSCHSLPKIKAIRLCISPHRKMLIKFGGLISWYSFYKKLICMIL